MPSIHAPATTVNDSARPSDIGGWRVAAAAVRHTPYNPSQSASVSQSPEALTGKLLLVLLL